MVSITFDQLYLVLISAVVGVIINELYKKIPFKAGLVFFGKYQRASRLEELKIIKNHRFDDRHYLYELQIAQNWFIALVVVAIFNFLFLLSNGFLEYSIWFLIIGMLPTYTIEVIWLNKMGYIDDLKVYQKGSLEWKKRKQRKIAYKQRRKLKLEQEKEAA
ncbi:hypothetical protein [Psychrobacter proteolyticus]|uniref:hypothetical protein n=1 Tax=Psychrobacter proteolyticus TaxID=147825 RepID=UPI000E0C2254|nr:hypothetical protein [Psychrobacter proteolyticus]